MPSRGGPSARHGDLNLHHGGQHLQAGANRQYSSGGSVRITAANNPIVTILSRQLAAHGRVPIVLKTSADGSGSVMIQRVGQTGFDWYGVDLQ